jgi:hypothetical protein
MNAIEKSDFPIGASSQSSNEKFMSKAQMTEARKSQIVYQITLHLLSSMIKYRPESVAVFGIQLQVCPYTFKAKHGHVSGYF